MTSLTILLLPLYHFTMRQIMTPFRSVRKFELKQNKPRSARTPMKVCDEEIWRITNGIYVKNYQSHVQSKGDKANFRQACKKFSLENEQLMENTQKLLFPKIGGRPGRREIIRDVHEGLNQNMWKLSTTFAQRTSPSLFFSRLG